MAVSMLRSCIHLAVAGAMLAAPVAAQADVRPQPTTFGISKDDDYTGIEPPGWLWGGIGVLTTLGLLVFLSGGSDGGVGQPNSPR